MVKIIKVTFFLFSLSLSLLFSQNTDNYLWIKGFLVKNENIKNNCTNHSHVFYSNSKFYCINISKSKISLNTINKYVNQYVNIFSISPDDNSEININDIKLITLPKEIHVIDGNANKYEISNNTIQYFPVEPIMSSSGFYSGGEYKKGNINVFNFVDIYQYIEKLTEKKNILISNRIKGSTLIILYFDDKEQSYIFKDNENVSKLFDMLNKLLNN